MRTNTRIGVVSVAVLIYVYPPRKLHQIPKRVAQRFLSAAGVGRAITDQSYPGLPKKANEWTHTLLQSYQNNAIAHFRRQELDFFSVSLDGTRLGKREGGLAHCPLRAGDRRHLLVPSAGRVLRQPIRSTANFCIKNLLSGGLTQPHSYI